MPWTPLFEEAAESEIIQKMMVVIHRDMKAALDHWYLADNLPDFAVMTEGDQDVFQYPLLALAVDSGASEETISGEYLDQELRVGAGLIVSGTSIKDVRLKARKYIRAFKAVIRKGVLELLPAADDYTEYSLGFRWQYRPHGEKELLFTQPAVIETRIKFGEK